MLGDVIQLDGVWWLWDPPDSLLKYFQASAALFFKQNARDFCGRIQAVLPSSSSCQVSLLRPAGELPNLYYKRMMTQSFPQNLSCGR